MGRKGKLNEIVSKIKGKFDISKQFSQCPLCGRYGLDDMFETYDIIHGKTKRIVNTCSYCGKTIDIRTGQIAE